MRSVQLACLGAAWFGIVPARAFADADIVVTGQGAGWTDGTPAVSVGGNLGSTLGEQRRIAVDFAASLWSQWLNSSVPIQVRVTFDDMGCTNQGAILGQSGATSGAYGITKNGADPKQWYVSALANRLTGQDLAPGEPDIELRINSSLDEPPCRNILGGFYYGLDGRPTGDAGFNDLIQVVLHELAHGLGFAFMVDLDTGDNVVPGISDAFSAHIRDLTSGKLWSELDPAGRVQSFTHVRKLVFDGPRVRDASRTLLDLGSPNLMLSPPVHGFSGFVSTAAFASNPATASVSGPVVALASTADGCTGELKGVRGAVVLAAPACDPLSLAEAAADGGAVGVLIVVPSPVWLPARPLSGSSGSVNLPVLTVGQSDADAIAEALQTGPVTATLSGSIAIRLGADDEQRPYLYATQPLDPGTSISHFDPLAHPDLLMEPFSTLPVKHTPDLTLPALQDIGWANMCGDGHVDLGETCDDGNARSDTLPDACRTDCQLAHCGDGVVDTGEACDDGANNGATGAGACSKDCQRVLCEPVAGFMACGEDPACRARCGGSGVRSDAGGAGGAADVGGDGPRVYGGDVESASTQGQGCGCSAPGASREADARRLWFALVAGCAWLLSLRRRVRR